MLFDFTGEEKEVLCEVGFPQDHFRFPRNLQMLQIPLVRSFSSFGKASVFWSTREDSAEAGKDFVASSGVGEFADGQSEIDLKIPLVPSSRAKKESVSFIVELGEIHGNASEGIYETVVHLDPEEDLKELKGY